MTSLLSLPTELLTQICLFLPLPRDTKLLASTCRGLRDKLTVPNNYLWFTFLSTFPLLRHQLCSFHHYPNKILQPLYAAKGKFDYRVNYYALALSILCGRTPGCFDCFNIRRPSLREVRIGGVYYRTYCPSCYERHFELVSNFSIAWPEIEIPPSLVTVDRISSGSETIHINDAIFLIKDQLSPYARSTEGRFISKWRLKLNARKEQYVGSQNPREGDIDERMLNGAEMEAIIKTMLYIYENDTTFKKFWSLGDKQDLKEYLERCALDILPTISTKLLDAIRSTCDILGRAGVGLCDILGRAGVGLWEIRDTLLRKDDDHTVGTSWESVEGGREGYAMEICKRYLMGMFQIEPRSNLVEPRSNLVDLWMRDYLAKRVGWGGVGVTIKGGSDNYKPYYCSFCKEEGPGEEVEEDSNRIGARKLEPLENMRKLGLHILLRHCERFEERWVTGGGVIEALGNRKPRKPFWKAVRALDD
ncbi:hypothetical protein TWF506_008059 [Arthrobotrys conoides]|uniref:F-box domain-containing protein n=1 Tax=Arthrobotrys conoides TaxID=74498 RepID=A0AAN8NIJ7_9PEZI